MEQPRSDAEAEPLLREGAKGACFSPADVEGFEVDGPRIPAERFVLLGFAVGFSAREEKYRFKGFQNQGP